MDWWMNPNIAGLPSKRQSAMGWANTVGTKMDRDARDESIKLNVAPESIKAVIGSAIPGICKGIRNETSD